MARTENLKQKVSRHVDRLFREHHPQTRDALRDATRWRTRGGPSVHRRRRVSPMPNPGGKPRSRRRNPDEFGVSSLSLGGSSRRKRKDEGRLDLETYEAARLASGLTTACDYAHAACELSELLERGYAAAEKRCANALWQDCLLAVSSAAHLERTVETNEALDALLRAARRVLPAARRAELERAHRRMAMVRKRCERRRGDCFDDDGDRDFERGRDGSDDNDDDDFAADTVPHLTRVAALTRATFGDLPGDVLDLVLDRLHPHALARAACVSREWRARAESANRWRALALAAFGEKRCAAAAAGFEKNERTDPACAARAPSSPRSWRRAFLAARTRWPDTAPRKHTGRAFCETCQTLAWFPSRGVVSSTPRGVLSQKASCGCAAATFGGFFERYKKTSTRPSRGTVSKTVSKRLPDAAVSAASVALAFAVTPRHAARYLLRTARRKARRRNQASSDSSSDSSASSSSGSASSSDDDRRLWQRNG